MEMQADEKPETRSESVLPIYVSWFPQKQTLKKINKKDRGPEIPTENLFPEPYLFGCLSIIRGENNTEQQMTE